MDVLKLMQDFISGSSITQGDYEVISIHLNNVDIIKNEQMEKAVPPVKPNLSRQVDLSFVPLYPNFSGQIHYCKNF